MKGNGEEGPCLLSVFSDVWQSKGVVGLSRRMYSILKDLYFANRDASVRGRGCTSLFLYEGETKELHEKNRNKRERGV